MIDSTKQIGFRGTLAYRAKIQQAALDRGVKVQGLIESALEAYLSASGHAPKPSVFDGRYPYAESNRSLHDKLESVLNSGDQGTIDAVVPNIELFFDRLRPVAKRRAGGK